MKRVTLTQERFHALVRAASRVGCVCADPDNRAHEDKCIGCWALAKRVEHLRELIAEGERLGTRRSPAIALMLEECEGEQQFRAREIPKAARRLAEARAEDARLAAEARERTKP